jgi:hypothetical protein
MKFQTHFVCLLIGVALVLTQGCGDKESDFHPLSGGFGVVATRGGIDSGPAAKLYYKDNKSKLTLIWPFLAPRGEPMQFTNDMIFLIADMPDELGRLGTGVYLAVQAAGPALDVSEDLLKLWSESNHVDFDKVKGRYMPLEVRGVPAGVEVHYLGNEKLPVTLAVSWEQLSNIIQDVKLMGKRYETEKYHAVYLKKDYSSVSGGK